MLVSVYQSNYVQLTELDVSLDLERHSGKQKNVARIEHI